MRRLRIEFRAISLLQSGDITRIFDGRALHAEANSKERHFVFARVLNSVDHSLNAAFAESAGNENSIIAVQACFRSRGRIDFFGFDPLENGLVIVRQAAVKQGFAQAFVRIFELHVLANDCDARLARRMMHSVDQVEPRFHVRSVVFQLQEAEDLRVQTFFAQLRGDGVNGVHIFHGNDAGFRDVAEEGDFFL